MSDEGFGGLLAGLAQRWSDHAKQVPLGLNSMPADFINAYVLGSVGHTEAITGACASFLYVPQAAIYAMVVAESPSSAILKQESPGNYGGLLQYSALGSEENLCKLDGTETADLRRASRPFGYNCGLITAESSQYLVLMDDALAVELGADIHGAVPMYLLTPRC